MKHAEFCRLSEQSERQLSQHPFAKDALLANVEGIFQHRDVVEDFVTHISGSSTSGEDEGDNLHVATSISSNLYLLHPVDNFSDGLPSAHIPKSLDVFGPRVWCLVAVVIPEKQRWVLPSFNFSLFNFDGDLQVRWYEVSICELRGANRGDTHVKDCFTLVVHKS